jgi:hypothetical protein
VHPSSELPASSLPPPINHRCINPFVLELIQYLIGFVQAVGASPCFGVWSVESRLIILSVIEFFIDI